MRVYLSLYFIIFISAICTKSLEPAFIRRNSYNKAIYPSRVPLHQFPITVQEYSTIRKNHYRSETLDELYKIGVEVLGSTKLPHYRDEAWRHTSVKKLFSGQHMKPQKIYDINIQVSEEIRKHVDASCVESYLVFIDGIYEPSISCTSSIPEHVIASSINSAAKEISMLLPGVSSTFTIIPDQGEYPRDSYGSDHLTGLTMANMADMACVSIPDGVRLNVPIQILFCHTTAASAAAVTTSAATQSSNSTASSEAAQEKGVAASYPCLAVLVGAGAQLTLKQTHLTLPDALIGPSYPAGDCSDSTRLIPPNFVAGTTRVVLQAGSVLQHTYMQSSQNMTRQVEVLTANLAGRDSRYDLTVLQSGGAVARVNVHIDVNAEDSNCTLNAVTLAGPHQNLDLHATIRHNATGGRTRQQHRNIVADKSEAVFKGRIRIPTHAQKTDADQLCRSLLLGGRARVQAMPTLEISADDVACSHGASFSDLDENALFYLAARGIDRKEAKKLMLRGFAFDVLGTCLLDAKDHIRIEEKLAALSHSDDAVDLRNEHTKYISI